MGEGKRRLRTVRTTPIRRTSNVRRIWYLVLGTVVVVYDRLRYEELGKSTAYVALRTFLSLRSEILRMRT